MKLWSFYFCILTSCPLAGEKMLVNVLKMQVMSEEDELAYSPEIRFDPRCSSIFN